MKIELSDIDTKNKDVVPEVESGDGIVRTYSQCLEWASKVGCDLRVASNQELFVDIDTEAQYSQFTKVVEWLNAQHMVFNNWDTHPSKSGLPHRHCVVRLRQPASLVERIALQSILGSDPIREAISLKRANNGEENVVIFFEPSKGYLPK